jgi:ribosomal protein S18 acetylase RimI-like enzyme
MYGGFCLEVNVEIRKLTPELTKDYLHFFDTTPHATNKGEHKCYCVWWSSADIEGEDYSSVEKRRDLAAKYIKGNNIQGYLAYYDNKAVAWCNANTKSDCYKCYCWRNFMSSVHTEESSPETRVKSIFCFAVAPEMRRKGIAQLLLERVCKDAREDGFDFVEAYPNKEFIDEAEDYMGPILLYERAGFTVYYETEQKVVMRRSFK